MITKTIVPPMLALAALLLTSTSVWAQAIQPDPKEDLPTRDDSGCLGTARTMDESGIRFETFMTSAIHLSPQSTAATLPLHKGYVGPGVDFPSYYILTEASDCATAKQLGINYAPKLGFLIDDAGNPINS